MMKKYVRKTNVNNNRSNHDDILVTNHMHNVQFQYNDNVFHFDIMVVDDNHQLDKIK
jgi:hypothetical protein